MVAVDALFVMASSISILRLISLFAAKSWPDETTDKSPLVQVLECVKSALGDWRFHRASKELLHTAQEEHGDHCADEESLEMGLLSNDEDVPDSQGKDIRPSGPGENGSLGLDAAEGVTTIRNLS